MNFHHVAAGLLSYAFQSGLLLAVGLILPRALRVRHPRTMLVYWRLLLLVVLLLPLLMAVWQPKAPLPTLAIDGLTVEAVVATALPAVVQAFDWRIVISAVAVVALLALLRLVVGLAYLNRCRFEAVPLEPPPAPVRTMQRRLRLSTPFLVSRRFPVPITFGWRRPAVIVPETFRELSEDEQEGVACHELLHVRRRDWPITVLEEFLRAVVWFHPAVWILLPKIALSREQVVDEGAVRLTGKRRQYLDALWRVVCTDQRHANALVVPLLGRSHLVERVAWLKKEKPMSKSRIVMSVLVLTVSVAVAGLVGASVFPAASETAMRIAPPAIPDDPKSEEKDAKGDKLKTVSKDSECDEITHPEVIQKVNPKYPEEARKAMIMGIVIVETVINEKGTVDDIEVVESPDELLSEAAVEAIRQWTFEPALCDGRPVGVYYNVTLKFRLE
jgi:TonB family protein